MFLGESMVLRCFAKRNGMGELRFGGFWGCGRCPHVGVGGGGAIMCFKEFIVLGS
jgi:hypothetical protein